MYTRYMRTVARSFKNTPEITFRSCLECNGSTFTVECKQMYTEFVLAPIAPGTKEFNLICNKCGTTCRVAKPKRYLPAEVLAQFKTPADVYIVPLLLGLVVVVLVLLS